ncbi:Uncharacterised protein [uncultured archaeon]|nr:Uncharacterised protein [uncultured archaeon]
MDTKKAFVFGLVALGLVAAAVFSLRSGEGGVPVQVSLRGNSSLIAPQATTTTVNPVEYSTTSSTAFTSTTTTASSTIASTTSSSTLPRFLEVSWFKLDKCRETVLGGMNTVYANVTGNISENWGPNPNPKFYYSCGGGEMKPFEKVLLRGEGEVDAYGNVADEYRLGVHCGRNAVLEDLANCRDELRIFVDTSSFSFASPTECNISVSTTSTTVPPNPYLDKFRGQGYRMAMFHIAWLCPSCVPAVNSEVNSEPGVKSRSLVYNDDVSYVVYDPKTVKLDRVLELASAGGDLTFINDTEI